MNLRSLFPRLAFGTVALCFACEVPAAVNTLRLKVNTLPLSTNKPPAKATVVGTNRGNMFTVSLPAATRLMVRNGSVLTNVAASGKEGASTLYQVEAGKPYFKHGPALGPARLSTNSQRLPGTIATVIDGKELECFVTMRLQSSEMEATTNGYEGVLNVYLRSTNATAFRSPPIDFSLLTSPGLRVGITNFALTYLGKEMLQPVPIFCKSARSDASVFLHSALLGDRVFDVEFDSDWSAELIYLGGTFMGLLGGFMRAWQQSRIKNPWKHTVMGGFCGLVLSLLGQIGVSTIFHLEGPMTTGVLLGCCALIGYFGMPMLSRFIPKLG